MQDSLPKQKKLISISESAKILGVSIDTIRRWDKSGILHSERPDGKNRYFLLNELEKYKSSQPLSISEAVKELNISATTLRRLETRGLIKPNRNNAGEREFSRDSIKDFLKSDYFSRKKQVNEKISEPKQKKKEMLEDHTAQNETQHTEFLEEMSLSQNLKLHQRTPELVVTAVVFLLLVAFGIKNTMFFPVKITPSYPDSSVLSETVEIREITPPVEIAEPKIILTIKTDNKSAIVNIRQKPTINSNKIGTTKDGDTFEFVSVDLEWYEVKLIDGSIGFISAKYIKKGDVNN